MSKIAIVPARGGSKRIPKKNIKLFLGKPIIAYSIEVAVQSDLFDEVMVSTDDEEIAEVATRYGASVPFFRSEKNSDDFADLNDVLSEVLECFKTNQRKFDYGCCILPTTPFVTIKNLKEAFSVMMNGGFDSVRPIVKFSYPIQRAFKLVSGSRVQRFSPEYENARSQDLEPAYHDAGQFYWFKTDTLLRGSNKGAIVIREWEAHDIDSIDDWQMAELKMKMILYNKA